jgi:hypothetical protein
MLPDEKIKCHHTGFKMTCLDGVVKHHCQKWMQMIGKHPQSEELINRHGCADSFLPIVMIENTQLQHQTAKAVESMRNEIVKRMDSQTGITLEPVLPRKAIQ